MQPLKISCSTQPRRFKTLNSDPQHFEQNFDGILFYSPSGVQGFCKENELKDSTAFCIGTTTAAEAKKHTDKVVISKEPTVKGLVHQTVETQNIASLR